MLWESAAAFWAARASTEHWFCNGSKVPQHRAEHERPGARRRSLPGPLVRHGLARLPSSALQQASSVPEEIASLVANPGRLEQARDASSKTCGLRCRRGCRSLARPVANRRSRHARAADGHARAEARRRLDDVRLGEDVDVVDGEGELRRGARGACAQSASLAAAEAAERGATHRGRTHSTRRLGA